MEDVKAVLFPYLERFVSSVDVKGDVKLTEKYFGREVGHDASTCEPDIHNPTTIFGAWYRYPKKYFEGLLKERDLEYYEQLPDVVCGITIQRIGVQEQYRRQGICSAMLTKLEALIEASTYLHFVCIQEVISDEMLQLVFYRNQYTSRTSQEATFYAFPKANPVE